MHYTNQHRKGFTLVEVMVTLSILSIALILCSQFLLSNMQTYKRADNDIKAQYAAQKVVDRLTQDIMESKGVSAILDVDGNDVISTVSSTPIEVSKVTFNGTGITYIYDKNAKTIKAEDSVPKTVMSGADITRFALAPLNNKDFEHARGLLYEITARVNQREVTLKNELYYRDEY